MSTVLPSGDHTAIGPLVGPDLPIDSLPDQQPSSAPEHPAASPPDHQPSSAPQHPASSLPDHQPSSAPQHPASSLPDQQPSSAPEHPAASRPDHQPSSASEHPASSLPGRPASSPGRPAGSLPGHPPGALAGAVAVYGLNPGPGPRRTERAAPDLLFAYQRHIVLSHAGAVGDPLDDEDVRAALLARLAGLACGGSGASPEVLTALANLLNTGVHPVVPEIGSVGASDLGALAAVGE